MTWRTPLAVIATAMLAMLGCMPAPESPPAASPETVAVVVTAISEQFGIPTTEIDPDAPFAELDPRPDELDVVELIMRVEEQLGTEVTDEAMIREAGSDDISVIASSLTARGLANAVSR